MVAALQRAVRHRITIALLVVTACRHDAEEPPPHLVIDEVCAGATDDDRFTIRNAGDRAVDLSELAFVDRRGDFVRARRFADVVLMPGARHVQRVRRDEVGFRLGAHDDLWIYRVEDDVEVAGVDWRRGSTEPRPLCKVDDPFASHLSDGLGGVDNLAIGRDGEIDRLGIRDE
jgi:hypothetical protein